MESNKNRNNLKIAMGVLIALLVVVGFYTTNLYISSNKTEHDLRAQKQLVINDLNAMVKQYDQAIAENNVTNTHLTEAKSRIEGLMDSLKVSETNLKTLWRYKQKYVSLQKEMTALLNQNSILKTKNSSLTTSLDSTRADLKARTMFSDSLLAQNNALAEVVSNASVLSAVNLNASAVIVRSSGKVIPTERAKRSDKIRVCFIVPENKLIASGNQKLFVQIINPKNNIIGLNEQITFGENTLNYSIISKFNYENSNLSICEFIEDSRKFEQGRYIVHIFNEKDLIASSFFTLK